MPVSLLLVEEQSSTQPVSVTQSGTGPQGRLSVHACRVCLRIRRGTQTTVYFVDAAVLRCLMMDPGLFACFVCFCILNTELGLVLFV